METLNVAGYFGAFLVGVVLGLLGGGGSIMAIPIFTYLFQISPVTTTAYSLFVVGTTASIGVLRNWKKGLVNFRIAIDFAVPAFIAVFFVRKFMLPLIPTVLVTFKNFMVTKDMVLMVILAIIMFISGISMIWKRNLHHNELKLTGYNFKLIVFQGIIIGLITGLVGIGGGFLIIPTLVLLVKLPMKKAVATSLFIIAIKSLIGFMGDLGNIDIHWEFLLRFTTVSTMGIFTGMYLSSYIEGEKLKKSFGCMVMVLSIGIFYKEIFC